MNRRFHWRGVVASGLLVVLAGCASAPGAGCDPIADPAASTTTAPDGSTTTVPDGSTTTVPDGSTTTVPDGGDEAVRIENVEVEDCLSSIGEDAMVDTVQIVDCTHEHQAEVYSQFDLEPGQLPDAEGTPGYPGGNELTWFAQDQCQARFEDYVGESYWTSRYDLKVITPSFSTWDLGDRTITCLVIDGDGGSLSGPARGA